MSKIKTLNKKTYFEYYASQKVSLQLILILKEKR